MDVSSSAEISTKLRGVAKAYARALQELLGRKLASVALYGSVARGEASAQSDIDLLIVAEGLPRGVFARKALLEPADRAIEPLLDALAQEQILTRLSRILKRPEEAQITVPLYLDMTEDAVLLYDRDGFFASVLDGVRRSLARLGSQRKRFGKYRYWDLKPDFKPGDTYEI